MTTPPLAMLQLIQRYWSKVDRGSPDDCWLWTGEVNNMGYGRFTVYSVNRERSRVLAHRLAVLLSGRALPEGTAVMHVCDRPACVNPSHLEVGTQHENIRDAVSKGRLDMSGLRALTPRACRTCGQGFLGVPSRRYCDLHQRKGSTTEAERDRLRRRNTVTL